MTDPLLQSIQDAVLRKTEKNCSVEGSDSVSELLKDKVSGYDFNKGINYSNLLQSFLKVGFQATNFGLAIKQIDAMVKNFLNICLF